MKKHKTIIKSIATIAFTGLWLVCPHSLYAQGKDKRSSEISLTLGGPTSSLSYDVAGADVRQGTGINLGLEYTLYFSNNFGVSLGAEYQRFKAKTKASKLSGAYEAVDFEQENFEFRYSMERFEEEQKLGFVNIPIMFVYQNHEHNFYIKGGAKIGIPISGKFNSSYDLSTSGYYPQYEGELFDPEFMGFGEFNNVDAQGDADVNISYIATFEAGIIQPIGKSKFYAGFYIDYGLNNIADKNSAPVNYTVQESGAGFGYNSIINSDHIDSIKTLSLGFKLRYSVFNF